MQDGLGRALELARGSSSVRFELFGEVMRAMVQLGGDLADVDTHLEVEGLRLVHEWHQLKVTINLGQLQHDSANAKAALLLHLLARPALAQEEARAADHCREEAEEWDRELRASNAALEREIEA